MPGARWLPLTIDVDEYAPSQQQQPSGPPSVLHLPSRSVPPIKGTQIIEPVLDDLDSRGVIRWVRSDIVPHATFRLMLAQVDIVIDQILGGSYGVTTVEAMAAGAVVVGNVEAHTVTHMPEAPPVVQASPQDLMTVLACVAADRDLRRAHVDAGGAFVRRWHDGRAAAAALGNFLCPGSNQQSGIR